jgi:S1-C subfamily serine protease
MFFKQVKTKKISENTWEVDSQSVATPIIDSVEEAISYAAARVKSIGFGKNGLKLGVSSNVCAGELDRSGFLVDELNAEVRQKAGLLEGDIIKHVNGNKVHNIIDLMFLFLEVREGSTSVVNVELLREDKATTLTYIVK